MIKYNIKLCLLFVVLLFPVLAVDAKEKSSAAVSHACKNLALVTSTEHLLYQLYSNLDSACLFETPPDDLENVWGIYVTDLRDEKRSSFRDRVQSYKLPRYSKLSKNIGVLIQKFEDGKLQLAVDTIGEGAALDSSILSTQDKFPDLLPPPEQEYSPVMIAGKPWGKPRTVGVYRGDYAYYWKGKKLTLLMKSAFFGYVHRFEVFFN
ncbi:Uncharacterised protein [Kingella potus]|uniref:Uncharacterized protein n=1 Tax=Kingella potus TaxID=265175 RepID=A0A377R092_9NEIS|nr:hypothetical protein [Kingella potus]UOP01428.1 hypothetical protein LVJ84_04250 [Kingella potus]STR00248.1 Uncharacterised protein [Kingella potus]